MHYFSVEKPRISVEITEISPGIHRNFVFEFKSPIRSEIAKSAEISAEIPFPADGGIRLTNEKENPDANTRSNFFVQTAELDSTVNSHAQYNTTARAA